MTQQMITLTSSAAQHIQSALVKRGKGVGLRLGIRKSGCSGWAYAIDIAKQAHADERVFSSHGIEIRVPEASLVQLEGTEIDFVSQGLNQQFQFKNPRVTGQCGCGESFTTAEEQG